MRVLVCGGRDFKDFDMLCRELDELHAERTFTEVIEGGAGGADIMGHDWAKLNGVPTICYLADWETYGRAAGPLRNQRMLDEGKPDLVITFPGGRGTADLVRRAKAVGIPIREIS